MNKIKRLSLNNFTAFREGDFTFSPGINVFIGENGTGKTHLLKLIYALVQICRETVGKNEEEINDLLASGILRSVFKPQATAQMIHKAAVAKGRIADETIATVELWYGKDWVKYSFATIVNIPTSEKFNWRGKVKTEPPETIFLPSRELLSIYPGFIATYQRREIPYDSTYLDLAVALNATPLRQNKFEEVKHLSEPLAEVLGSEDNITLENDRFYIDLLDAGRLEAQLVAEGYRKLATLAYLVRNGSLTPDSVLLWDEPEANLNPKLVTAVVEFLVNLANAGAQIFIATHDYLLSQELSLQVEYKGNTNMKFFSLYRGEEMDGVQVESGNSLDDIQNNPILDGYLAHHVREDKLSYIVD